MPRNAVAYDDDFFEWTMEQARLLRSGELAEIDRENIAEELESMGKSLRRELRSRAVVLIVYLLKWKYQPRLRSRSWSGTASEQRHQIEYVLDDAPSLKAVIPVELATLYKVAREKAANETGLGEQMFPVECPFTPEQILSPDFLPEE
jgi:hypothetical protein